MNPRLRESVSSSSSSHPRQSISAHRPGSHLPIGPDLKSVPVGLSSTLSKPAGRPAGEVLVRESDEISEMRFPTIFNRMIEALSDASVRRWLNAVDAVLRRRVLTPRVPLIIRLRATKRRGGNYPPAGCSSHSAGAQMIVLRAFLIFSRLSS